MISNEDFGIFYAKYYRISFRIAYAMVKDYSAAEDICQEVFSKLYENPEKIDLSNERKLYGFVKTVTVNQTRDYYRKAHVKREFAASDEMARTNVEDRKNSVENLILCMEENEYMKLILEKLRRKNAMNYEILWKVKYLDIPPDVVAKEFGITRNSVNNRILRTKRWIEAELSRLYGE